MRDGGTVIFIAENQEYIDKILPLADWIGTLNSRRTQMTTFARSDPNRLQ